MLITTTEPFHNEFDALFRKCGGRVLQAAFRTIKNQADAKDILQTVFLRLIERPELHESFRKNPEGYLYRSAINEALNVIAARNREKVTDEDFDSLEIPVPEPASANEQDVRLVRAALAAMKPDRAELLNLYYIEELDCRAIAKLQGKRPDAVFMALFRARREFKKAIRSQEKENETQEKHERAGRAVVA